MALDMLTPMLAMMGIERSDLPDIAALIERLKPIPDQLVRIEMMQEQLLHMLGAVPPAPAPQAVIETTASNDAA